MITSNLKPGRELDVEIAEKVMGWTKCQAYSYRTFGDHWTTVKESKLKWSMDQDGTTYHECGCLNFQKKDMSWSPSRNIGSAWEVVEKLVSLGYSVDVSSYPRDRKWLMPPYENAPAKEWTLRANEKDCHQCVISRYEKDAGCWIVHVDEPLAPTAPHTICLTALEAVA